MIITFQEFLNEESLAPEGLVYGEAVILGQLENQIIDYVKKEYKFNSNFPPTKDLDSISVSSKSGVDKLIKFAKKHNDQYILTLINTYLDKIENLKVIIDARKYNI